MPIRHLSRGLCLLGCVLVSACASHRALEGPPHDMRAVYHDALEGPPPAPKLTPQPLAVGPEAPYTPLMQPPAVQRVWVPAHLNEARDLIAGHWVYLVLRPWHWFIETQPTPPRFTLQPPVAPLRPAVVPPPEEPSP